MKKTFLFLLILATSYTFSQNSGITYQAVIYNPNGEELPGVDNSNALLTNQDICLRFGIIDGNGLVEYQENASVTTDNFGMVNLLIGTHEQTGGYAANFASITWGDNTKFLKVDLDIEGSCTDFEELSNQPFTYVPFAYYSPASDVPGPAGPAGADGQDGATGADGQDGATGAVGPSGALGADGAVGPRGPVGVTGSQGVQGPQGIQGPDGADGSAGSTGAQGPIGPQGANGLLDSGDNIGDIVYWDGSQWTILPIGSEGDVLTVIDALPSWSPQATDAPPTINLIGENPQLINVNTNYVELGATAYDEVDGDITSSIVIDSSLVDTSVVGSYNVTYTVTDSSGNIVMATRQVSVNPVDSVDPCDNGEIQNYCDIDVDEINFSGTVTDIDGNTYNYISYNSTDWTVDDASMVTYRDGTPIPYVYGYGSDEWNSLTTGAWQYENDDPTLNKIYNAYAKAGVHDNDSSTPNKELAPEGWHVPTGDEWANLVQYVTSIYGDFYLKALSSSTGWPCSTIPFSPGYNQSTNNCSGFNAKPKIVPANIWSFGVWYFWSSTNSFLENGNNVSGSYGFAYNSTFSIDNSQSIATQAYKMRFVKD